MFLKNSGSQDFYGKLGKFEPRRGGGINKIPNIIVFRYGNDMYKPLGMPCVLKTNCGNFSEKF